MKWLDRSIIVGPYLTLCLSERDCWKAFDACNVPKADRGEWVLPGACATTHTIRRQDGQVACIVALRTWGERDPVTVAGLLVHEAVHVWQSCRDDQMRESKPGIETEAYAIQWISQQLMWSFVDQTRGKP